MGGAVGASLTSPSLIAALLLQMGRYRNAQYASEWILLVCLGEFSNKREFAWVNPVNKISNVARTVAHRFKEKKIVRHCNLKKLL